MNRAERIKALDAEIGRLLYHEGAHHPRIKPLMEEQARLEKEEAAIKKGVAA